jgi:uncharacterized protein YunC (DUF1805 family)/acylphosphatase
MGKEVEIVRVELTVYGSVQMVSFKYRVSDIADNLGVVGQISNNPNKTVSIIAEGEKSKILEFVEQIKIHPMTSEQIMEIKDKGEFVPPQPLAKVEKIEGGDNLLLYTGDYNKFEIIPEETNKELVNSLRTASHLIDRLRTDMYHNFQTLNNNYLQALEKIKNYRIDVVMKDIIFKKIKVEDEEADGYSINIGNSPLLIIKAKKGYVMCGYLNIAAANKLGDIAGRVTGVKDFDDVLNAVVIDVSENAKKMGLKTGMKGMDFLKMLI